MPSGHCAVSMQRGRKKPESEIEFDVIDLYCERVGAGISGEPLNALSNGFFLLVAVRCALEARCLGQRESVALAAVLFAIGIGSALFHTLATGWAQWLDVIPILAFQLLYLGCYLRRLIHLRHSQCVSLVAVFAALIGLASAFPALVNGSLGYVPAALVLVLLGMESRRAEGDMMVSLAATLFVVSLLARSIDNALCEIWPYGTHFVWHSLNAGVLYLILTAYMRSARHTT
jgi:hypothetical protein